MDSVLWRFVVKKTIFKTGISGPLTQVGAQSSETIKSLNDEAKKEEAELISGCLRGSNKHQERLYKKYYGYVMAISLSYCANRDTASEVVDDTFMKVFDFLHAYDPKQPFKAWLRRITINCAIDELRRNKKHMNHLDVTEYPVGLPSVALIDTLAVADIYTIIGQLPDVLRTVFNLYEVEGYSHKEIAALLEIGESSSRTYLARAKERLRNIVKRHFE